MPTSKNPKQNSHLDMQSIAAQAGAAYREYESPSLYGGAAKKYGVIEIDVPAWKDPVQLLRYDIENNTVRIGLWSASTNTLFNHDVISKEDFTALIVDVLKEKIERLHQKIIDEGPKQKRFAEIAKASKVYTPPQFVGLSEYSTPEDQRNALSAISTMLRNAIPDILQKQSDVIERIKNIPVSKDTFPVTPDTARGVSQCEYGVVRGDHHQYIIGTTAAASCVAIAAWNPVTKVAALAHVDAFTNLDSVKTMFDEVKIGRGHHKIQVHLASAGQAPEEFAKILTFVQQDSQLNLKTVNHGSPRLAINASTGQVTTALKFEELDHGKDREKRQSEAAKRERNKPLTKVAEELYLHPAPQDWQTKLREDLSKPRQRVRGKGKTTEPTPTDFNFRA